MLAGEFIWRASSEGWPQYWRRMWSVTPAIEFQQAVANTNNDQPEDLRIVFRIGLHLGDLIVDGDDLYGDGVNIAARLEAEASPGGIVLSRAVHDAIAGKPWMTLHDLGELPLKNIERPVQSFRVQWNMADWPAPLESEPSASMKHAGPALALPEKPSIAVLPFQNMSGDPEQEYFVDGLVEDIITAVSRISWFFVIARNSSFTYRGRAVDIRDVGRELGVRYVVEGSVRRCAIGCVSPPHSSTREPVSMSGLIATMVPWRTCSTCRTG